MNDVKMIQVALSDLEWAAQRLPDATLKITDRMMAIIYQMHEESKAPGAANVSGVLETCTALTVCLYAVRRLIDGIQGGKDDDNKWHGHSAVSSIGPDLYAYALDTVDAMAEIDSAMMGSFSDLSAQEWDKLLAICRNAVEIMAVATTDVKPGGAMQ